MAIPDGPLCARGGGERDYSVVRALRAADRVAAEALAHDELAADRLGGEWFRAPLERVLGAVEQAVASVNAGAASVA
jgi:hypothetical protein